MTSIRTRLLAAAAIGVSLVFLVSGALVLLLTRSSLHDQFDDALIARAHALSALVEQEGEQIDVELDSEGTPGDPAFFEVWDGETVLVRSTSLRGHDLARPSGDLVIEDVDLPDGSTGRQVTLHFIPRVDPKHPLVGPGKHVTLAIARATSEVSDAVARVAQVLIGVGLLGTLLCLAILAGVVRFGLSPLRSLAAAIAQLREGDLALKLDGATPAELAPVVDRLDELLRRLASAFARERELTAEVAHELRTPLAGLRATLEVALQRQDRPPEKYRAAMTDCLAITRDTERMVTAMLSLARLDAGTATASVESVDLDELVREVLAPLTARASERRVSVITRLAPVTTTTDRDKLRVVIQNLLDNAVSHVDEGGQIEVELADQRLTITNTCSTLAPEDAGRVFDRFWRGDAARSAGTHAGLGLALCSKLVAVLGGTIRAGVRDGVFTITVLLRNVAAPTATLPSGDHGA